VELVKALYAKLRLARGVANRQATGNNGQMGSDVKFKSAFNIRRVLAWENRPGMDGLALRD